jgi:hypothetical protein
MRRAFALVAAVAVLAGCAQRKKSGPAPQPLMVCVQNGAQAYGNLIARVGTMRYDVMPGKEVCKRITETGPNLALTATTIGGGAAGPLNFATTFYPTGSRCWVWRLTSAQASQSDVVPCEHDRT